MISLLQSEIGAIGLAAGRGELEVSVVTAAEEITWFDQQLATSHDLGAVNLPQFDGQLGSTRKNPTSAKNNASLSRRVPA
jgi:hypothetical protein